MNDKPMRIFTSDLTRPPRYYVTRSYRSQIDTVQGIERVVVTGKKWDVTDDIEAILKARTQLQDECTCGSHPLAPLYHRADCYLCAGNAKTTLSPVR